MSTSWVGGHWARCWRGDIDIDIDIDIDVDLDVDLER
jgi:hypothetical protein